MDFIKKYLPIIAPIVAAVALFFVVSATYFSPQFSGEELPQHDVVQYEGMVHDIRECRAEYGEDPQWTGGMFGGMPAYMINVAYPAQAVKNTLTPITRVMDTPAAFILFAMLAMWAMLWMVGINPWIAIVGGLAYGLSTYFFLIIGAGHITKMWALVYAPLMMGGAWLTLRKNLWVGAAVTALFTSLEIGANHPQITYYFVVAMAIMWLSELWYNACQHTLKEFAKRSLVLALAGAIALGSNFSPLWYTLQHSPDTTRGGSELTTSEVGAEGLDLEYATDWSYGRLESWNMLIPNFMGGTSMDGFSRNGEVSTALQEYGLSDVAQQLPAYWGDQPYTAGPTYLGAVVILLAILGLILADNRNRWWVVIASLLALLLAWGRNFMPLTELMFNILPGYDKFRTVSMFLVVLEWSAPLMLAVALSKLWNSSEEQSRQLKRALYWATGVVGGITLLFAIAGSSLFDFGEAAAREEMTALFGNWLQQSGATEALNQGMDIALGDLTSAAMAQERFLIMQQDAWRSLLLILITAAIVWLYIGRRINRGVLIGSIVAMLIIDLVPVNLRYLSHDNFVQSSSNRVYPTLADKKILQDKELGYRVFNLTVSPFNDATTSYFHRSIGGYHGAKLSRYQDIIEHYLSNFDEGVLDMLNTRYLIISKDSVVRRESANGAAWFVDHIITTTSPREEILALSEIDTRHTAIISEQDLDLATAIEGGFTQDSLADAHIELVEYRPNYLKYNYYSSEPRVAIFSEIFYNKGWRAYVDGVESPYFRADYILRAMQLPEGEHTVEWRFRAPKWSVIEGITLLCSIMILVGVLLALTLPAYRKFKQKATKEDER